MSIPTALQFVQADARQLAGRIDANSIDLVVTSPPYWGCRDYEHPDQIGRENSAECYIDALLTALDSWKPLLRAHASVMINVDDIFQRGSLVGLPAMFEIAVRKHGWLVANRALWAKDRGVPEPNANRLARRYEFIFHLALTRHFYFDLYALKERLGHPSNPGDVWHIEQARSATDHLAPFPPELVRRAILLACPERICPGCGQPHKRRLEPTADLDPNRKQAQRALELYQQSDLTEEHLAAIRAVGISDAGKGRRIQNGAGKNSARTQRLADEAKEVLGGYFREFTFAPKRHTGWITCDCQVAPQPATVLDPFMGSGTTLRVARELARNAIGADLVPLAQERLRWLEE